MLFRIACASLLLVGLTAAVEPQASIAAKPGTDIEVKPTMIRLNGPPAEATQQSFLVRYRQGGMKVLSAKATDPAIVLDVKEERPGEIYLFTATIPAEYHTASRTEPVELRVETDVAGEPVVRVPVSIPDKLIGHDMGWMNRLSRIVGQRWPRTVLPAQDGSGQLEIQANGQVTVVVFSAHYCGHCDEHMPQLETIAREYGPKGVRFMGIAAGTGNGQGIQMAANRWGIEWDLGVDWGYRVAGRLGVRVYPAVFLLGPDGTVEAVHGRINNKPKENGLDFLEIQLRSELDLLLAGQSRESFPDWEKVFTPRAATQPAHLERAEPTSPRAATQPSGIVPLGGSVRAHAAAWNKGD